MKDHFPYNAYDLEGVMNKKGYKFFKGDYDLNIIGVRTDDNTSNTFNDYGHFLVPLILVHTTVKTLLM
jgi:hypothetical protein